MLERFAKLARGQDMVEPSFLAVMSSFLPQDISLSAHQLAQRYARAIFDAFCDSCGAVSVTSLAPGLSVLCGGSRDRKVDLCFYLYDLDNDGALTVTELEKYLQSVLTMRLLFADADAASEVSELAKRMTRLCFSHTAAMRKHTDRIFPSEFKAWYRSWPQYADTVSPPAVATASSSAKASAGADATATTGDNDDVGAQRRPTLEELRGVTSLGEYVACVWWGGVRMQTRVLTHGRVRGGCRHDVDDVLHSFAIAASSDGSLARAAFDSVMRRYVKRSTARVDTVLSSVFDAFDRDGNGVVDFTELATGLTLLCGGDRATRLRAAFALYDHNRDGYVTKDDMRRYLTSLLTLTLSADGNGDGNGDGDGSGSGSDDDVHASAEELAFAATENCFRDADLNYDGRLSFAEFAAWTALYAPRGGVAVKTAEDAYANLVASPPTDRAGARATAGGQPGNDGGFDADAGAGQAEVALELARSVLGLDLHSPENVVAAVLSAARGGVVSRPQFRRVCLALERGSGSDSDSDGGGAQAGASAAVESAIDRLFDAFDSDGNGELDEVELAAGFALVAGEDMAARLRAVFSMFDADGDGYVTAPEMRAYLTSVFQLATAQAARAAARRAGSGRDVPHAPAPELARRVTERCFRAADADHDGRLSFQEFVAWYEHLGLHVGEDIGGLLLRVADTPHLRITLDHVHRTTALGAASPYAVVQALARACDSKGALTRDAFEAALAPFAAGSDAAAPPSPATRARLRPILSHVFDLFDTQAQGSLLLESVAAGVTYLCGRHASKEYVEAVFPIYDVEDDGCVVCVAVWLRGCVAV